MDEHHGNSTMMRSTIALRAKNEEVDAVCERIEELLDKETKGKDYTLIVGDWNAIGGEGKEDVYVLVGHYGLGYTRRNDRAETRGVLQT